jgi:3-phosphoshikimate 1-carboxyvinyltransferase
VRFAHAPLQPLVIAPSEVPGLIDELPALSVLGLYGAGLRVTGAAELRAKESDRIAALVTGLTSLGALARELPDGFELQPAGRLRGGTADAAGDHRLAMTFALAALGADAPCAIEGAGAVAVSYPGFFDVLRDLCEA